MYNQLPDQKRKERGPHPRRPAPRHYAPSHYPSKVNPILILTMNEIGHLV